MSDYSAEESQKITQTLGRIKSLYVDQSVEEKEDIYRVFAEILEDPFYKDNMSHYFQKFLTEKY
tara:strand:- start:197 stop:388 length:192 start_codon:yes stop_codon:yes gene_type:complete